MAESNELFNEVAQMRDELEEQGAMIGALVHMSGVELREEIIKQMTNDLALREVFLQVDGKRTQADIVTDLETRSVAKKSSISLKFDKLSQDYGLIQLVRQTRGGKIYKRTRLSGTLRIERELRQANLGSKR